MTLFLPGYRSSSQDQDVHIRNIVVFAFDLRAENDDFLNRDYISESLAGFHNGSAIFCFQIDFLDCPHGIFHLQFWILSYTSPVTTL